MTIAVVLPGMNGTGALLEEFMAALAPEFDATVVCYPTNLPLGYDDLESIVRHALPSDAVYLLVAESFSGPLAIRVAATCPPGLIGVALCATFAETSRYRFPRFSPAMRLFPFRLLPTALLMLPMMGTWSSRRWLKRIDHELRVVASDVIAKRISAAARIDVSGSLGAIECQVLYLRAAYDRLINRDSGDLILERVPHAVLEAMPGPHSCCKLYHCNAPRQSRNISGSAPHRPQSLNDSRCVSRRQATPPQWHRRQRLAPGSPVVVRRNGNW